MRRLAVALISCAAATAEAAATRSIFLWYSDGQTSPGEGPPCSGRRPPQYRCTFGDSVDSCKRQVQTYLDRWYADFNVIFTFTRPTSGAYYTVVITSGGAWCGQEPFVAGVAPIDCGDMPGAIAYALACGDNPLLCASTIAQEQAHLVGLAHTTSRTDLMFPVFQAAADSFENRSSTTQGSDCRSAQNSHAMMLDRLGAWPGGPKPSPFAATPDAGVEAGGERDAGGGGVVVGGARVDASGSVGPGDALVRGFPDADPPPPDAAIVRSGGGGCGAGGGRPSGAALLFTLLTAGLAHAAGRQIRGRRDGRWRKQTRPAR